MKTKELASSLRTVISILHKSLRKQMYSVNSLSLTEMETIGHLIRNTTLLPSELANLTRVKTQSMSQIIKKLEELEIITRTPSTKDGRKVYISLTEYGKQAVEKTRFDRDEWLTEAIEQTLTLEEIELLEKAIPVLNKIVPIN
ncbi:MarR family winged helix-turn-helix transcriptional regulator [Flavobacterium pectinovorum]|jgi:DNA-binding MarR family transcriptional regulator|uniref:MarR family transcriptional regulator n=1 Tax=Flavobacterium pectinovorum TaxID=29533 RepID=A0A502EF24_9FLAO|nr:MarR family transcriptional regulator [Flavobacterium pectinovorum]TPG36325.1 MarR family transcriptional regulator [Flavobacterium pectinovorum]